MAFEEFYEGFDPEKQKEYEQYLVDRYGTVAEAKIAESKERAKAWSPADCKDFKEMGERINNRFADARKRKLDPASDHVQAVTREHYAWISRCYDPTDAYENLGRLYCEHPEFRQYFEAYQPGLAEYMARAMQLFAQSLSG